MKSRSGFILWLSISLATYCAGWLTANARNEEELNRVIAVSWGDGQYGKAFYGARVFEVPRSTGLSVHAIVAISPNGVRFHDCGEIGRAESHADAVSRWGQIAWREDGLHIGSDLDGYFMPRAKL